MLDTEWTIEYQASSIQRGLQKFIWQIGVHLMHYRLPLMLPLTVIFLLLVISWKVYSYAEIHYTFFRYSLINRRYPELITDVPWRVDPGEPIPIVCIVKDADQFPIKLRRITAKYKTEDGEVGEKILLSEEKALHVSDHYWNMITFLELPPKRAGAMKHGRKILCSRKKDKQI